MDNSPIETLVFKVMIRNTARRVAQYVHLIMQEQPQQEKMRLCFDDNDHETVLDVLCILAQRSDVFAARIKAYPNLVPIEIRDAAGVPRVYAQK